MNTVLLSIIRSEQVRRNAPAVLALNKIRAAEASIWQRWGQLLKLVPSAMRESITAQQQLLKLGWNELMLPGGGHKYEEVREELIQAGISHELGNGYNSKPIALSKRLYIAVLTCLFVFKYWALLLTATTRDYYAVLLTYYSLSHFIASNYSKVANWVIIGDLSPFLIVLSAACKRNQHKVIYWQYSLLDFKPLPVHADKAVILNDSGKDLSRIKKGHPFYWRRLDEFQDLKLAKMTGGPIGILLNVHAHEASIAVIQELHQKLGLPFLVRLHPNSTLSLSGLPSDISKADSKQSLEEFAEGISLGICGNTQAQAKLLMLGVPVVQIKGLDVLEYDFHNYIKNYVVKGYKSPNEFEFDEVATFYKSNNYKNGLIKLLGPLGEHRRPKLDKSLLSA